MDKKFRLLNFYTEYSSKGSTEVKMQVTYCFSDVFYSERNGIVQNNKYTIKLYKTEARLNEKNNNFCLTDRRGIINHLRILKRLFKFGYCLKELDDYFELTVLIKGDIIYHKYFLCWVRYLYEYPFNVFLADANKLKKLPEFKFESIINLFNLVGATSGICLHGTGIHAIGVTENFKELLTLNEIKQSLKELEHGHTRINDTFPEVDENTLNNLNTIEKGGDGKLYSMHYWNSERSFSARAKIYKSNYKVLINKKKEK